MASRWRKSLLLTYSDNYHYGTSLYSSTAEDAGKKYQDTISRTYPRSDRGDLRLSGYGEAPTVDSGAATDKSSKNSGADLYAPMSFGYGRSYYNNLRASSEPRTTRKSRGTKKSPSSHETIDEEETTKGIKSGIEKVSKTAKSSSEYSFEKTVTSPTVAAAGWLPVKYDLYKLTTPLNRVTPSDQRYAEDEAADLNVSSSYVFEKSNYGFWTEKGQ